MIPKDTYVVFYVLCIISRLNGEKKAKQMKKQTQFCSNFLTWRMRYDVMR